MDYIKPRKIQFHFSPILLIVFAFSFTMGACQGINLPGNSIITPTIDNGQPKKTPTIKPANTPTPQPTSQFQVDESELQGLSLTLWHTWDGKEGEMINQLVADFNQENGWKIKVDSEFKGGVDEMGEAVYDAINTGGFPHIVMGYPYQASYWNSARKLILDIDTYRTDPVWGLSVEDEKGYYPIFQLQADAPDQWGFPAERTAQFLIYNKAWAKELGFNTAPQTPAELKKQACAANKSMLKDEDEENDTKGGLVLSINYPTSLGWIYAFGGEVVAQDGKGYEFNTSEVKDTFTYLRSLFDGGCAWVSDNQPAIDEFSRREGLFISGNLDALRVLDTAMSLADNNDEWEIIPFPSPDESPVMVVYGPDYFILESSPAEQLASWLFIKWLSMPENQVKLIAAGGKLPLQSSGLEDLNINKPPVPEWQAVVELLPYAKSEPTLFSWGAVRWAVGDATSQLFQWYFEPDQIPAVAKLLDETAASLYKKNQ